MRRDVPMWPKPAATVCSCAFRVIHDHATERDKMLQLALGLGPATNGLMLAATKTKSSSTLPLLIMILLFFALYFLWIRPQRNKVRQQQLAQVRAISVGDEVVTQAGIVGTVQWLDDERVGVEIAAGTTIVVVRSAIGRRISPEVIDTHVDEDHTESAAGTPGIDPLDSGANETPGGTDPNDSRKWWPGSGGGKS